MPYNAMIVKVWLDYVKDKMQKLHIIPTIPPGLKSK